MLATTASRWALLGANGLPASATIIRPGQQLQIPGTSANQSPGAVSAAPASSSGLTYTVVSGDTLGRIARSAGVSLGSLLAAPNLTATTIIRPGQQLKIPAGGTAPTTPAAPTLAAPTPAPAAGTSTTTYTVVQGDTLSEIARRQGMTLSALLTSNGLTATTIIRPGQQIRVTTAAVPAAPAATRNPRVSTVLQFALAQVGKPYKFFTKGADTFDCSGLTMAAYRQVGIDLVHQSAAQALQGAAVDCLNAPIAAGDLVVLDGDHNGVIDHVGIAIHSRTWVQASDPRRGVVTGPLPARSAIVAVRRFV